MTRFPALRLIVRTLLQALPAVLGIVLLNFLLLQAVPGDAAQVLAAESGSATAEMMAELRERFGLDLPVLQQLLAYLDNLSRLSLGYSPRFNLPVAELIGSRLGNTLLLMSAALAFALVCGVLMGTLMGMTAGRWPDRALSLVALVLYSTPGFWLALMAIVVFSVTLGWLPSGGTATIGANLQGTAWFLDRARYLVLPALTMSAFYVAIFARLTRAAFLEVSRLDFVRTAQAKGLHPARIVIHHILRNALIPVTTVAGLHLGAMLGGAVVIESVFGWPGLGRLAFESVMARDHIVLLGILLMSSLLVIAANLAVDLLQLVLDPRVEVR
ncbi:MAG: ABC transporter permease [Betaproteobacteria bacterium]|nr:ABC transporter permease [Betaproteobacteria bacterium]